LSEAVARSPIGELVDIDDVGLTTAFLGRRSPAGSPARRSTSTAASTSWRDRQWSIEHWSLPGSIVALAIFRLGVSMLGGEVI
jgi:hypothetical protein